MKEKRKKLKERGHMPVVRARLSQVLGTHTHTLDSCLWGQTRGLVFPPVGSGKNFKSARTDLKCWYYLNSSKFAVCTICFGSKQKPIAVRYVLYLLNLSLMQRIFAGLTKGLLVNKMLISYELPLWMGCFIVSSLWTESKLKCGAFWKRPCGDKISNHITVNC